MGTSQPINGTHIPPLTPRRGGRVISRMSKQKPVPTEAELIGIVKKYAATDARPAASAIGILSLGMTVREIAERVEMSPAWVGALLHWHNTGYVGDTPWSVQRARQKERKAEAKAAAVAKPDLKVVGGTDAEARGAVRVADMAKGMRTKPEPNPYCAEASADQRKAEAGPVAVTDKIIPAAEPGPVPVLVVETEQDRIGPSPEYLALFEPILRGTVKNDPKKSAGARDALIACVARACWEAIPQMTPEDIEAAENAVGNMFNVISDTVDNIEREDRDAKREKAALARIKREAKNPAAAYKKALEDAQQDAWENSGEMEDAKENNKGSGDAWGDVKEDALAEWVTDTWAEYAKDFEAEFKRDWIEEHGQASWDEHHAPRTAGAEA